MNATDIEFKPEWKGAMPTSRQHSSAAFHASTRVPVIIAEDDLVSRTLLVAILRTAGYSPIITSNGGDAMSALRLQSKPCVAIVDWMMPTMDGAEVCLRVRESGQLVHVIMLTSRGRKEDAIEALDAGADDYLVKPFDRGELLARVRAGMRTLDVQAALSHRAQELERVVSAASLSSLRMPL